MTPDEIEDVISQCLSDDLTAQERLGFESHRKSDPIFDNEVHMLLDLWRQLGLLAAPEPSAAMRINFYQKLNSIVNPAKEPKKQWWNRRFVWQAAAACLLFAGGIEVGRFQMPGMHQKPSDILELRGEVEGLRQTVALSLLDKPFASSRLEGLEWTSQIEHPDQELMTALVSTLNQDANINVRLSALDALEKFSSDSNVRKAMEQSIPKQHSPLVQIALIDALVHIHDRQAAQQFRQLTTNTAIEDVVRQRARWAVEKLSLN